MKSPYQAPQSPAYVGTPAGMEQLATLNRKMDDLHRKMDILMGKATDIEAQYDAPAITDIPF